MPSPALISASAGAGAGAASVPASGVLARRRLAALGSVRWLAGRPWPSAIATIVVSVAAATAAIYPLKTLAPVVALSVVYLPAVLLASARWGLAAGLASSLASAAAFNFFHIPPVGQFTIADSRNWVALAAFTVVAAVVSAMAERARARASEAELRRAEADLAAALARELLAGASVRERLGAATHRLASALGLPSAALELRALPGDQRRLALELSDSSGGRIGTLLVPREATAEQHARISARVVPTLEALLEVALRRDALAAEAVQTAALRHADEVKTALLRAVSHDLRTPLTAIVAGGHALRSPSLTDADRRELANAVVQEAERLAGLVDKLLDLSRLQAGVGSRRAWTALEEVIDAARCTLPATARLRVAVDPGLPEVCVDGAQLERALANLLENAQRHGGGEILIRARASRTQVLVSVVDRGPGIGAEEQRRIFEPFYRGAGAAHGGKDAIASGGSGLGLAIARGLVQANGGALTVSSLPGQGASFTIALPLERQPVADCR